MIEVLLVILYIAFAITIGVTLVGKTGHNRWLGVALAIPILNAIVIIYLLLSTWPIQRELAFRRLQLGEAGADDARLVYLDATRMQQLGQFLEAKRRFAMIVERLPASQIAHDAQLSLSQNEKHGA